jgi:hypothetical protein
MHLKSISIAVAIASIAASALLAGPAGADSWLSYQNDRYGTTIDYPDIFKAQPPPDNDDGQAFKSADGAKFSVFASYNASDFNLDEFRDFIVKNLDPGAVITFQAHGVHWFVVSGISGTNIFYERHLLSHKAEMTEGFVMTYPAQLKQIYDPIVARMSKSFRGGTGFQTPDDKP